MKDNVFLSLTYDGISYSKEAPVTYSTPGDYTQQFIARRLGNVDSKFSMKLRWVTYGRMCFSLARIKYG